MWSVKASVAAPAGNVPACYVRARQSGVNSLGALLLTNEAGAAAVAVVSDDVNRTLHVQLPHVTRGIDRRVVVAQHTLVASAHVAAIAGFAGCLVVNWELRCCLFFFSIRNQS